MATSAGAYFKELNALYKCIEKITDGQAKIDDTVEYDDDEDGSETTCFGIVITPNDGLYRGASIRFKIKIPEAYPDEPPEPQCLNQVYHPNINLLDDDDGHICVSLLGEDWQPEVGLDGCVMAILFLFHNPNVSDALSPVIDSCMPMDEFEANVAASLRGEDVDSVRFDRLIPEEADTEEKSDRDDKGSQNTDVDKIKSDVEDIASETTAVTEANNASLGDIDVEEKDEKTPNALDNEENCDKDNTAPDNGEDKNEESNYSPVISTTNYCIEDIQHGKVTANDTNDTIKDTDNLNLSSQIQFTDNLLVTTNPTFPSTSNELENIQNSEHFTIAEESTLSINSLSPNCVHADPHHTEVEFKRADSSAKVHLKALFVFGSFYRWLKKCFGTEANATNR